MSPDFHYERGHPAGWTDDLGIIADRNQWVQKHHAGWYWRTRTGQWFEKLHDIANRIQPNWQVTPTMDTVNIWYTHNYVYVRYEEDVMWFKMLW